MKLGKIVWALALGLTFSSGVFAEDTDPFLAPGETDGTLPAPSLGTPASSENNTTPPASETAAAAPAQPAEQAPIPLSSIPGKTESSPSAVAAPPKDIYEEYDEFLEKESDRATSEDRYKQRNMFAHEGGSWQFGLEYAHRAFADYNFNFKGSSACPTCTLGNTKVFADTQGAILSLGYFPIHSLTFGRLGIMGSAGIYFSKFTIDTPEVGQSGATGNTVRDDAKRHQADAFGVRAVYEFQYFLGQMFVPYITAGYEQVRMAPYKVGISTTTGTTTVLDIPANNISTQSYGAGLHFNLNRLEPVVASRGMVNVGVKKFYLTYLALQRTGSLTGLTHSLGLRFEF